MASQLRKSLRHLLTRNGIIKRRNGNIATVDNLSPITVRVDIRTGVESSKGGLSRRGMANCSRTKSSAYNSKSAAAHTSFPCVITHLVDSSQRYQKVLLRWRYQIAPKGSADTWYTRDEQTFQCQRMTTSNPISEGGFFCLDSNHTSWPHLSSSSCSSSFVHSLPSWLS